MKKIPFPILFFLIIACNFEVAQERQLTYSENKFSTESAEKAIEIIELLVNNTEVSESEWEDLYKSVGYENYLIYSDSTTKKKLIRDAIETVFDPTLKNKLDSLLAIPHQMDRNYFKLSLIRNFNKLKNNISTAKEFLKTTDFGALIASGDSVAKLHLPKAIQDSLPELYDIHMILSDPDAKVMDNAIVFDLNMALEQGEKGLIKIIAHEFHHNYRKLTAKSYDHPLMIQLNKIHQEGIADLIDKDEPPIHKLGLYPMSIIDAYNSDYENTPKNLMRLDTLTNRFLRNEIDTVTYFGQLENYFAFGGHTAGFYISSNIAKKRNRDVLIDSYNDPVKFIRIYNQVAQESTDDHIFSSSFINYIELLDKQVTTKPTLH